MKWIKSVGTTTGAEHLQDGKACVYFEDLSDKNKRQYKLQKASWFHIGLRQTKCSLLTYCWIVKAKAVKEKKKKKKEKKQSLLFPCPSTRNIVVPWYPTVNTICYGWCEEELVRLTVLENFIHFIVVDMSVKRKNQTISVTKVGNTFIKTGIEFQ